MARNGANSSPGRTNPTAPIGYDLGAERDNGLHRPLRKVLAEQWPENASAAEVSWRVSSETQGPLRFQPARWWIRGGAIALCCRHDSLGTPAVSRRS